MATKKKRKAPSKKGFLENIFQRVVKGVTENPDLAFAAGSEIKDTVNTMVKNAQESSRRQEREGIALAIFIQSTHPSYSDQTAKSAFEAADAFLAERERQRAQAANPYSTPNIPPMPSK